MFMGFVLWIVLSMLVGVFANNRGRSGVLYFFLSILISPLLTFLIILLMANNTKVICNKCRKEIDKNAKVCPYCLDNKSEKKEKIESTKKQNLITQIDNTTSKLIIEKESTELILSEIKKIIIDNYDKKYNPQITIDNKNRFFIKSTADNYQSNHIQIEIKEDAYIVEGYNISIPKQLETNNQNTNDINKYETPSSNLKTNNVDRLIELGKLYKDGILTKEEFDSQKELLKWLILDNKIMNINKL